MLSKIEIRNGKFSINNIRGNRWTKYGNDRIYLEIKREIQNKPAYIRPVWDSLGHIDLKKMKYVAPQWLGSETKVREILAENGITLEEIIESYKN